MKMTRAEQVRLGAATPPNGRRKVADDVRALLGSHRESERLIAGYILTHGADLPYQSAVSLASKLGVSPVTVGRFCRTLGFQHFRELKAALRSEGNVAPWLAGGQFDSFLAGKRDAGTLRTAFETEMSAISKVYELPLRPEWPRMVTALADSPNVWVAGFQLERGAAAMFAYELQYLRPNVHLVDGASGHFADALMSGTAKDCVLIVDVYRYSRHAALLASHTKQLGRTLGVLADTECAWAHQYTDLVLGAEVKAGGQWASMGPLSSLSSLLLGDVARALGPSVKKRLEAMSELYRSFVGYVGESG